MLFSYANFQHSRKQKFTSHCHFRLTLECQDALGMENGGVIDEEITASSELKHILKQLVALENRPIVAKMICLLVSSFLPNLCCFVN